MNYQPYGTKKSTPSRRTRKTQRNTVFISNYTMRRKLARERRKKQETEE